MRSILLFLLVIGTTATAQQSKQFKINGSVKQPQRVTLDSLKKHNKISIDSIIIYNHLMKRKSSINKVNGVLLKDILTNIEIIADSPKRLSEYYIICTASDNYKVVFSWNEVFNSKNGNGIMILTSFEPNPAKAEKGDIAIIAPNDEATGRRFLKGLNQITILKAN
ncbi:hypothetical protein D3C87_406120 [compost metagenome]